MSYTSWNKEVTPWSVLIPANLPTINARKIIWEAPVLVQRLIFFLETNNVLQSPQFEFIEGRFCENTLRVILTPFVDSIVHEKCTSLVLLDIQEVFGNVKWHDIIQQLQKHNYQRNIARVIGSYLSQRSILISWVSGNSTHTLEKVCQQRSCLGPILWLIIANLILRELEKRAPPPYLPICRRFYFYILMPYTSEFGAKDWLSSPCVLTATGIPTPTFFTRKISNSDIFKTTPPVFQEPNQFRQQDRCTICP